MLQLVADRFAVGHLRRTNVGLDLELAPHPVDENVEMQFAHALHDRLAALDVGLDAERRILGGQPGKSNAHLFLVGLGLGFDGDLDHRIRERHRLQYHRLLVR